MPESNAAPDPPSSVAVRMYRGLLGDCFLLTHSAQGKTFRALIDCGVLQCIGSNKPATKLGRKHVRAVVQNLQAEIATAEQPGGVLDLVIATHEHFDHLSGFMEGFGIFEAIEIREVWMAWTEDPQDADANAFRSSTRLALSKLAAVARMHSLAAESGREDTLTSIGNLLQFYGDLDEPPEAGPLALAASTDNGESSASAPRSCAGILNWLKQKAGRARFLQPGDIVSFGVGDALKAYVLGPPRTTPRLKQLDPKRGPAREVYLARVDEISSLDTILRLHNARGASGTTVDFEDAPFAARFGKPIGEPIYWTEKLYFDESDGAGRAGRRRDATPSRRIDGEWLTTAEMLALKIDGDVNNTSLALAIEVEPAGRVLLFPADAQVGNWLSWHDQTYPISPGPNDSQPITAADLLRRTVLYKVGHHASHNATLREQGLELMTSPHLTALIPVVEKVAQEQTSKNNPSGWSMPYPDLRDRLQQLTRDRVLRGDGKPPSEQAAFTKAGSIFVLSYADAGENPLWLQVSLDLQ